MAEPVPLLCVAGTLCDERVFEPLLAEMSEDAALPVTLGATSSVTTEAKRILAAAPGRFVALGFSLGGFVVVEMMRTAPERVAAAVLISSHADPDDPANATRRRAEVEFAERQGSSALVDTLWPQYVAPHSLGRDELKTRVLAMAEATPVERFARQAEINIGRPDRRAWAREQTTPLLVVCGARDALSPTERYVRAAQSPHARLTVTPDAGHFVLLEEPARVAASVTGWLRETAQARPC